MNSVYVIYTLILVTVFFVVVIPIGKKIYPNGSGSCVPFWFYLINKTVRVILGLIGILLGFSLLIISGQILFNGEIVLGILGLLCSINISLYGFMSIGTICPEPDRADAE